MLRLRSPNESGPFAENFQARNVGWGFSVILPADQTGNAVSRLHSSPFENPVIGFCANPVTSTIDWFDIASPNEIAFVGPAMRERPVQFLSQFGIGVLAAIRPATKHDPVRPSVETVSIGCDPADRIT